MIDDGGSAPVSSEAVPETLRFGEALRIVEHIVTAKSRPADARRAVDR